MASQFLADNVPSKAQLIENLRSYAVFFTQESKQEVFCVDLAMVQPLCLLGRIGENPFALVRERQVDRCWNLLPDRQMRRDLFANILGGRRARHKAVKHVRVFTDQSKQQMLRLDSHTPELARLIAAEENDSPRCFGVPF